MSKERLRKAVRKFLDFDYRDGTHFCCGLIEVGDLSVDVFTPAMSANSDGSAGYIDQNGNEYDHDDVDDMLTNPDNLVPSPCFATTYTKEQKDVEKILVERGFKCLTTFTNPNSGHKLKLWFKK